jgi:hypothetical protein
MKKVSKLKNVVKIITKIQKIKILFLKQKLMFYSLKNYFFEELVDINCELCYY